MHERRSRRVILTLAVPAVAAATLAACSSSGSKSSAPTTAAATGATTATKGTSASKQSPGSTVNLATIDACTLLTAADATALGGATMVAGTGSGGGDCHYEGPGGPAVSGVEIGVRVDADAATAHSEFPRWVQPVPGALPPGYTITPASGVGDEASETHYVSGPSNSDGIFFRSGRVLVKIGAVPSADDAKLRAAAATVIGRL